MAEEQPAVSEDELKNIQAEIKQEEKQTLDSVKRDVAETVKKEMKQENDLTDLKESKEKLEAALETQKKESDDKLEAYKEEFKKEIQNLKDSRQGVARNDSPFEDKPVENNSGINLKDPEVIKTIEEETVQQFRDKHGLPDEFGRI